MILSVEGVSKFYGAEQILKEVDLKIEERDRIGIMGQNGAGKSTLLSLIAGQLDYESGTVSVRSGAVVGFLRQNTGLDGANTIRSEMELVFADLLRTERELQQMQEELAAIPHGDARHDALLHTYDERHAWFTQNGGYEIPVKIDTILNGMGFVGYDRETVIAKLSGGEKTRLAIAKLLLEQPDVLMLDEPTNHLDFRTLSWLEEYLKSYRGAVVLVSHDRYFLDQVVNTICELENGVLTRYPGGYSQYVRLKKERLERQEKEYEIQQQQIASMQDYIARNQARASTAKSARSRVNALERMELVEKPNTTRRVAHIRFELDRQPYKDVLLVEHLQLEVGEGAQRKRLADDISFKMERGEKIAVIGANGVGKSSLIKAVLGQLSCKGKVEWGKNIKVAYFDQENTQMHDEKTVLAQLWDEYPRMYEQQVRAILGAMLFSAEDVYKTVGSLSGGEKARLAFAMLMMQRANVLVLDEPTNHLDFLAKEALDEALSAYEGTVLMVSHDRYLLNRVPTRIVEMFGTEMVSYPGRYEDYLQKRVEPKAAVRQEKTESENKANYYRTKKQRSEDVRRKNRLRALEEEIAACEEQLAELEAQMADPAVAADYQRLQETCAAAEQVRQQHGELMDEWLSLAE